MLLLLPLVMFAMLLLLLLLALLPSLRHRRRRRLAVACVDVFHAHLVTCAREPARANVIVALPLCQPTDRVNERVLRGKAQCFSANRRGALALWAALVRVRTQVARVHSS